MVNEIAQWAVLGFVGIFVLGLTRQLGLFLVDPKDIRAQEEGPKLGDRAPDDLLSPAEQERVLGLMAVGRPRWIIAAVVDEDCPGCRSLLASLDEAGTPDGAPVLIFSRKSSADHRRYLERIADYVIVDDKRLKRLGFKTSPFVMVLDEGLHVVHKQLAPDLAAAVSRWKNQGARVVDEAPTESTNGHVAVGAVGVE